MRPGGYDLSGATVVRSEAMSARVAPHGVAQGARPTGGATSARRVASTGLRGRFSRGRRRSTPVVSAQTERTDATAAASGDDPAAFIRDFATVALKMQTAALRGVADVPSQLAKQLQRAAAPPPAGFPPGPPDDVAVALGADPLAFIVDTQRQHGDVVGLSLAGERGVLVSDPKVAAVQKTLKATDPINIQFTSGTTGFPKGATLTHRNILNNGFFIGECMKLGPDDRLCIPVPLYHCFGMVLGNLACLTHGSAIVYPNDGFDPLTVLETVQAEK